MSLGCTTRALPNHFLTITCVPSDCSGAGVVTTRRLAEQVRWHRSLEEVPVDAPAIVLAHEFFDALPVHHFQVAMPCPCLCTA